MKPQASVSAVNQLSLFSWPLLTVRGIATLLFLLASLIAFDKTMTLLVWFFAIHVFFDGAYSFIGLVSARVGSSLNRLLIGIGRMIGIAAGIAVILLAQGNHSLWHTLLTIFAWVALVGVVEGIWVIRGARNKEVVLRLLAPVPTCRWIAGAQAP
ncbi:MAG: hypothetical protein ACYCY2_12750 [Acidithiobacillus ferriphilus]